LCERETYRRLDLAQALGLVALEDLADYAISADDKGERERARTVRFSDLRAAVDERGFEPLASRERSHQRGVLISGHRHERESRRAIVAIQPLELWQLFEARLAPRTPKV
jgi:hypothetical protein